MFNLRKIFDLGKIFAVPKDFLKSKIYCTFVLSGCNTRKGNIRESKARFISNFVFGCQIDATKQQRALNFELVVSNQLFSVILVTYNYFKIQGHLLLGGVNVTTKFIWSNCSKVDSIVLWLWALRILRQAIAGNNTTVEIISRRAVDIITIITLYRTLYWTLHSIVI
jgi:hypothetical protein